MLSVGNFVGVSICQKLHENERNWTESGGGESLVPLGSATGLPNSNPVWIHACLSLIIREL